jgi:transcriptional regulator GlxA family with amidase domain
MIAREISATEQVTFMPTSVGIYLYPDVEVLDFAGPYEVFTTANRVALRQGTPPPFTTSTIAARKGLVRARAGLVVQPNHNFANHPPLDLLIIPGGVVAAEMGKPEVVRWIEKTSAHAGLTASVCTGAFLLAKASLLYAHKVTTHWEDIAELRATFPLLKVVEGCRWVDTGRYVTSAGISAGIDMSLHLVERIAGRELAEATAWQMDFDWRENE